jgi:hypothetical protein
MPWGWPRRAHAFTLDHRPNYAGLFWAPRLALSEPRIDAVDLRQVDDFLDLAERPGWNYHYGPGATRLAGYNPSNPPVNVGTFFFTARFSVCRTPLWCKTFVCTFSRLQLLFGGDSFVFSPLFRVGSPQTWVAHYRRGRHYISPCRAVPILRSRPRVSAAKNR